LNNKIRDAEEQIAVVMEEHKINALMKSAGIDDDDIADKLKEKENEW
jgi:hypothetical protein